jgi:hypothetical protein
MSTADAIIVSRTPKTFTADAIVTASSGTTRTKTFTADAVIKTTSTKTVTADAIIANGARTAQLVCTAGDVAGEVAFRYAWMPGVAEMIPDAQIRPDYDLVVVLDGDRRRLEAPVAAAQAAKRCVCSWMS